MSIPGPTQIVYHRVCFSVRRYVAQIQDMWCTFKDMWCNFKYAVQNQGRPTSLGGRGASPAAASSPFPFRGLIDRYFSPQKWTEV